MGTLRIYIANCGTAELADIFVGSEEGWSTVFARTKTEEEIVEGAREKGYIEAKEIEPKEKIRVNPRKSAS